MENEKKQNTQNEEVEETAIPEIPSKKSRFNPKVLIIGLPIFVVQLIAVYFITANILLKKMEARDTGAEGNGSEVENVAEDGENGKPDADTILGEHIFQIEDIIVNPANTNGQQLLLSSVAFDVPDEKFYKELEKKQILVKDLVISVLSGKTIAQLSNNTYKDTLRVEISDHVQSMLGGDIEINKVYFSKYIIN